MPDTTTMPIEVGATTVPVRYASLAPQQPRNLRTTGQTEVFAVVGAAGSALGLTTLLFTQLEPFNGIVGFVVVAYLLFLGVYALLVSFDESGPAIWDRVVSVFVHTVGVVLLLALLLVVGFTLWSGREALTHLNFYVSDMRQAGPLDPLSVGGSLHAIVGTLEQIGIGLALTIPLGLLAAVFLNEIRGRFSRFVRTIVEAMTALPSIVAGLFIYATVILTLGLPTSGFAAALAISVMMLPIIIRAADVVIRLVPGTLREASLALGASQWRTVWHVVLPTARSGLTTAVILGTARGVGETSPVLLTAGFSAVLNADPFNGPQVSLPLQAYQLSRSPSPEMVARGFATAALLMVLVLVLFIIARLIGGRTPGQLTPRQQLARAHASARDAQRFARRAGVTEPRAGGAEPRVGVTEPSKHREERDG